MARTMTMDADDKIFRVKILKKYRHTPEPILAYEGPYATAAAARARGTYWENYMADRDLDIDGTVLDESWAKSEVEVGTVTWRRLES